MTVDIINRLCPIVERKLLDLIGTNMSENCCLSIVASLDKFHRRLLAVQRLLLVEEQCSLSVIKVVARTVADRTASSLTTAWAEQLRQWNECWNDSNQPHDSVKHLEAALVEQMQRAFVALMVTIEDRSAITYVWVHLHTSSSGVRGKSCHFLK